MSAIVLRCFSGAVKPIPLMIAVRALDAALHLWIEEMANDRHSSEGSSAIDARLAAPRMGINSRLGE